MYGQNPYGTKRYAAETSDGEREEYYVNLFPLVPVFISEKNGNARPVRYTGL